MAGHSPSGSRPSYYHQHTLTLVGCSFSERLCYFYARCKGTQAFQKVQLLSRQFPKVLGIIKMFSGKTETSLYVPFAQEWRSSWNMQAILGSFYGGVMNTEASEACSSLDVVLGSFVTSWMSRRCAILGRFTTVPCFHHLWIMALTGVPQL